MRHPQAFLLIAAAFAMNACSPSSDSANTVSSSEDTADTQEEDSGYADLLSSAWQNIVRKNGTYLDYSADITEVIYAYTEEKPEFDSTTTRSTDLEMIQYIKDGTLYRKETNHTQADGKASSSLEIARYASGSTVILSASANGIQDDWDNIDLQYDETTSSKLYSAADLRKYIADYLPLGAITNVDAENITINETDYDWIQEKDSGTITLRASAKDMNAIAQSRLASDEELAEIAKDYKITEDTYTFTFETDGQLTEITSTIKAVLTTDQGETIDLPEIRTYTFNKFKVSDISPNEVDDLLNEEVEHAESLNLS